MDRGPEDDSGLEDEGDEDVTEAAAPAAVAVVRFVVCDVACCGRFGGGCCRKAAMKEERKKGRCEGMMYRFCRAKPVGYNVYEKVVAMRVSKGDDEVVRRFARSRREPWPLGWFSESERRGENQRSSPVNALACGVPGRRIRAMQTTQRAAPFFVSSLIIVMKDISPGKDEPEFTV